VSVTHAACQTAGHARVRHSPDGFNVIEECPTCCMAWVIAGITGDITRLDGSSYEHRLKIQHHENLTKNHVRPDAISSLTHP
jgi:hypothetical protein